MAENQQAQTQNPLAQHNASLVVSRCLFLEAPMNEGYNDKGKAIEELANSEDAILAKYVLNDFRILELPNYNGTGDPQRHVNKFERIIRLYAINEAIDEWFTSLVLGTVQKKDEPFQEFMDRFNIENLLVQDLKVDLVVSILLNSLHPGSFRLKLSRSLTKFMEELMIMFEKYINEEEFNKTMEHRKEKKEQRIETRSEKDKKPFKGKYQYYTPLPITQAQKTRDTPTKMTSKKYCNFHNDRGHKTEDCFQLKDEIEILIQQ
ncbi:hypothetical protein CDL12_10755 [Handroanthus impetiginosus]|uniref:Retrotransposon gag domain-containing protein n=1 Tax=Handroanthus impetiginosus TaxID=429701 RepID=A0A2G9HGE0_9LAMI|nr:hypothetical protein CDL12_10755 [Handroanthus impetiginosus]